MLSTIRDLLSGKTTTSTDNQRTEEIKRTPEANKDENELEGFLKAKAAGCLRSYALSLHDEPYQPNHRLLILALESLQKAMRINIKDNPFLYPPDQDPVEDVKLYADVFPGEHYKLLAALVAVMQPGRVVEIGTYRGISALAMRQFLRREAKIITYDVVPWGEVAGSALQKNHFDAHFEQRLYDLTVDEVDKEEIALLQQADLIFVDAAKDGVMEYKFCDLFERIRFTKPPIIVFDDIKMMQMLKLWRTIPHPKLDITSFGHWSGTGIVEWGGQC